MADNYIRNPTKSTRIVGGSRYIKPDTDQFGFYIKRAYNGIALDCVYWNAKKGTFADVQEATLYPAWEIAYKTMATIQKHSLFKQVTYTIVSSKEV